MLIRVLIATALALALTGVAQAASIFPACPQNAKKEIGVVVPAIADTTPCTCETVISCANLDKVSRRMTCQFYARNGTGQVGSDASTVVSSSGYSSCGTGSPEPLQIRSVNASAATGSGRFIGRVCGATRKFVCDAVLTCDCHSNANPGPLTEPLTFIVKKQKGD